MTGIAFTPSWLPFSFAGASIIGRNKLGTGKVLKGLNRQDAIDYEITPSAVVLTLADGCGSTPQAEIGATLLARLGALAFARAFDSSSQIPRKPEALAEFARQEILTQMKLIAAPLAGGRLSLAQVLENYFLTTLLVVVVTESETYAFSIGDNFLVLNGAISQRGPFPNNAPPYLVYSILPNNRFVGEDPSSLRFHLDALIKTAEITTLAFATDGLEYFLASGTSGGNHSSNTGSLDEFFADEAVFRNPAALERKLLVANRSLPSVELIHGNPFQPHIVWREGAYKDDLSLFLMRRINTQPALSPA
jgi:hypothetical protein